MVSYKKALLYGLLLWVIPFALGFIIFPLKGINSPLFSSIMTVVSTLFTVWFTLVCFNKLQTITFGEGLKLGLIWLVICLVLDLFFFMQGPMNMSFGAYMSEIGLKYISIPIITCGFAYCKKRCHAGN